MAPMNRKAHSEVSNNADRLPAQAAGKKRKANEVIEENANIDHINVEGMPIDESCNQVRSQIHRYLDSGAKVGEFGEVLGVSLNSLNTFLRQNGPMKGSGSNTYQEAWAFFKRREIAGVKKPTKKQKSDTDENDTKEKGASRKDATEKNVKASASKKTKEAGNSAGVEISGVQLPGEESDSVPVQDTCDEIRRKINAHLKQEGVTQAQFCRDMQGMLHSSRGSSFSMDILHKLDYLVMRVTADADQIFPSTGGCDKVRAIAKGSTLLTEQIHAMRK